MATATQPNGTAIAPVQRSLIESMASAYGLKGSDFYTAVKETVFGGKGSNAELMAFMLVANKHKLDPFTREIFAFPKGDGGIQTIVSVDGWLSIINNHSQMDGLETEEIFDEKGELSAVKCTIWRKDRKHPTIVTEYMAECRRNTPTWSKWPRRMLRHKATIQCGRVAFSISGIVDPDEAERETEARPAATGNRIAKAETGQRITPIQDMVEAEAVHDAPPHDDTNQDTGPTQEEIAHAESHDGELPGEDQGPTKEEILWNQIAEEMTEAREPVTLAAVERKYRGQFTGADLKKLLAMKDARRADIEKETSAAK